MYQCSKQFSTWKGSVLLTIYLLNCFIFFKFFFTVGDPMSSLKDIFAIYELYIWSTSNDFCCWYCSISWGHQHERNYGRKNKFHVNLSIIVFKCVMLYLCVYLYIMITNTLFIRKSFGLVRFDSPLHKIATKVYRQFKDVLPVKQNPLWR